MADRIKIAIADASDDQLVEFAKTVLGLRIHPQSKRETVIAKINLAQDGDTITVPAGSQGNKPAAQPAKSSLQSNPTVPAADDKVRILIETVEEPGGDKPVPVSVNGRAMLIPRGQEVDVPRRYVEVLSHAVRDIYDPLKDGGISTTPRKVPSYSFRIIADPASSQGRAA